jgi:hypothetical protein
MTTFREAAEARDLDLIASMLADDVVFRSPAVFHPYQGKPIVAAILRTVIEVMEGFHYVREFEDADGGHAYIFEAKVGGFELVGCDFLTYNDEGKISEFMVMARPMKALTALAEAMGARFAEIEAAARGR